MLHIRLCSSQSLVDSAIDAACHCVRMAEAWSVYRTLNPTMRLVDASWGTRHFRPLGPLPPSTPSRAVSALAGYTYLCGYEWTPPRFKALLVTP